MLVGNKTDLSDKRFTNFHSVMSHCFGDISEFFYLPGIYVLVNKVTLFTLYSCLFFSPLYFCQLLRYAYKRIVNNYNESVHRKEQLASRIKYDTVTNVDFIHVYCCEATHSMQYRLPNSNLKVSNTNHFGSVSDSLVRLVAAIQCMSSLFTLG